jgi:hypothetical protein
VRNRLLWMLLAETEAFSRAQSPCADVVL